MKKLAFVIGFAGSILALIFSLIMIYTVPLNILADFTEDVLDDFEKENVIAINEVALAMSDAQISDYSEENLLDFAADVAENSVILNDAEIYEDSMVFVYKYGVRVATSAVVIGISIIFALVAFIGALICRKAPTGAGIMMLLSALVLLLAAIYTGTVIPMIAAALLLTVAGIVVFIPTRQAAYTRPYYGAYQQPPAQPQQPIQYAQKPSGYTEQPVQYAQPQEQPSVPPQEPAQYTEPPIQNAAQPDAQPAENGAAQPVEPIDTPPGDVPFPDEEIQVFAQPEDDTRE